MRLRPEHEPADPDHARALHRAKKQRVRLLGSRSADRADVIALLVEDRIDVSEIDEFLDLDRSTALGGDRDELVVRDGHEVPARQLETADHVLPLDWTRGGGRGER